MGKDSEATLNHKFVETAKLMNIYLNHFPSFERHALSRDIRIAMYFVFKLIVRGQKLYFKKKTLDDLDVAHEEFRMFVNLANEFGYFEFRDGTRSEKTPKQLAAHRFLTISLLIDELGRMIGGWIRDEREKEKLREEQKKQQQREAS